VAAWSHLARTGSCTPSLLFFGTGADFCYHFFGETTFIDSYFGEIFTGLFFLKRCCPSCPLGSFLVQRNAGSQDRWIAEERLDIGC
jgi:hypothetical protein